MVRIRLLSENLEEYYIDEDDLSKGNETGNQSST